jgi:hypothetical protein
MHRLLLAFVLLPAPAVASGVALEYEVRYGLLRVLAVQTTARFEAERYEAASQMRTVGLVGALFPWTARATTRGVRDAAGLRPSRHHSLGAYRGSERSVSLDYGDRGSVRAAVVPPPEADDREAVPEAERIATIDPLTATLSALQSGCRGTLRVFDGRRRYDLVLDDLGDGTLPEATPIYDGPARHCRAGITPRAGFWRATDRQDERPAQIDVWIAAPRPDIQPVPVYLQLSGARGALDFQLSAANALP